MKSKLLSPAIFLPVLLLSACAGRSGTEHHNPVPVRVVPVEKITDAASRNYVGTVRPAKSAVLSCPYSGTLVSLLACEGEEVKKGDTIAVVESPAVRSTWKMAHAALEQAEDGYSRLMQVHESGSVPDVKAVEVKTQLDRARASAEAADSALAGCTVRAPFAGVLGDVFAETDNLVQAEATFRSVAEGYIPENANDDIMQSVNMRLEKLEELMNAPQGE